MLRRCSLGGLGGGVDLATATHPTNLRLQQNLRLELSFIIPKKK